MMDIDKSVSNGDDKPEATRDRSNTNEEQDENDFVVLNNDMSLTGTLGMQNGMPEEKEYICHLEECIEKMKGELIESARAMNSSFETIQKQQTELVSLRKENALLKERLSSAANESSFVDDVTDAEAAARVSRHPRADPTPTKQSLESAAPEARTMRECLRRLEEEKRVLIAENMMLRQQQPSASDPDDFSLINDDEGKEQCGNVKLRDLLMHLDEEREISAKYKNEVEVLTNEVKELRESKIHLTANLSDLENKNAMLRSEVAGLQDSHQQRSDSDKSLISYLKNHLEISSTENKRLKILLETERLKVQELSEALSKLEDYVQRRDTASTNKRDLDELTTRLLLSEEQRGQLSETVKRLEEENMRIVPLEAQMALFKQDFSTERSLNEVLKLELEKARFDLLRLQEGYQAGPESGDAAAPGAPSDVRQALGAAMSGSSYGFLTPSGGVDE